MKLGYVALLALLVVSPVAKAHAESTEIPLDKVIEIARQFESETGAGKEALRPIIKEMAEQNAALLADAAVQGREISTSQVDAGHLLNRLVVS